MSTRRFIGLDINADTMVAVAAGELRGYGVIPNQLEVIRGMVKNWVRPKSCEPPTKRVLPATSCSGS